MCWLECRKLWWSKIVHFVILSLNRYLITYHFGTKSHSFLSNIIHSWGFLGPTTTWGNVRVSQSFWGLENNSVGLKSLFCGIVWYEIQSYRKATCNLVVLTFIKKNFPHQGSNLGPSDQKSNALPTELSKLGWWTWYFLYIWIKNCPSDAFFGYMQGRRNSESMGGQYFWKYKGGGGGSGHNQPQMNDILPTALLSLTMGWKYFWSRFFFLDFIW